MCSLLLFYVIDSYWVALKSEEQLMKSCSTEITHNSLQTCYMHINNVTY